MTVLAITLASMALLPGATACEAGSESASESQSGTITIPLVATAPSGTVYRLRNADFEISGTDSARLSSDDDLEAVQLTVDLPEGGYTISISDRWYLEQEVDGTFEEVGARLLSASTQAFTVTDQETTVVRFSFLAGDDILELGNGRLVVELDVTESEGAGGAGGAGPSDLCRVRLDGATGSEPDGTIPVCCTAPATDQAAVDELYQLVNDYRVANALPVVTTDALLAETAQGHSLHMSEHPFFSHVAPEPAVENFTDRAELCGASVHTELLGMGVTTASQMLALWQDSPTHDAFLLESSVARIGAGYADGYWTLLFAL